jgi:inhibitor of KinA sporulation pathway (predicted exonuclease)
MYISMHTCTGIVCISQDTVDSADELPQVLEQFDTWLHSQGLYSDGIKFAVVTW